MCRQTRGSPPRGLPKTYNGIHKERPAVFEVQSLRRGEEREERHTGDAHCHNNPHPLPRNQLTSMSKFGVFMKIPRALVSYRAWEEEEGNGVAKRECVNVSENERESQ